MGRKKSRCEKYYYCKSCHRNHMYKSKIGQFHEIFKEVEMKKRSKIIMLVILGFAFLLPKNS